MAPLTARAGEGPGFGRRRASAARAGHAVFGFAVCALALLGLWSLPGCHGSRSSGSTAATVPATWTTTTPSGASPAARDGHSMVVDATSDRAIVFGGEEQPGNPPSLLNDVWVLANVSGATAPLWSRLAPSGVAPSARAFHAAAYDPGTNRMIVFGGNPNVGFCGGAVNEVWILDAANGLSGTPAWSQATPGGPAPSSRASPTVVFDATGDNLIVFGGVDPCGAIDSDVWVLASASGASATPSWTRLAPAGAITGRFEHAAVYDPASNRMIVFGGLVGAKQSAASPGNDVWVLTNANGAGGVPAWTPLSPSGTAPSARYGASAAYDASSNRLIVLAGVPASGASSETWVLTNANGLGGTPKWSQLIPGGTPPSARTSCGVVIASGRLGVFGGEDAAGTSRSDLFSLTGF